VISDWPRAYDCNHAFVTEILLIKTFNTQTKTQQKITDLLNQQIKYVSIVTDLL